MLDFEKVKNIILDELRSRGYAPNPADVVGATNKIIEHATEVLEKIVDAKVVEAMASKAAAPVAPTPAATPVMQPPPSK